jgi:hypothetical protein
MIKGDDADCSTNVLALNYNGDDNQMGVALFNLNWSEFNKVYCFVLLGNIQKLNQGDEFEKGSTMWSTC